MPWAVEEVTGTPAEVHALGLPPSPQRLVRLVRPTSEALVLGSTQSWVESDDIDVVRRRSGGGAVLVEPGGIAWVDVVVPRGDPWWDDDVGRAFWWLGDVWARTLRTLGVDGVDVYQGPMLRAPLARQVCFAGLGPGEVTAGGRKAVGMAQRRTRDGALFQCAVPLRWDGARLAELLGLEPFDLEVALVDRPAPEVTDAFLAQLPD